MRLAPLFIASSLAAFVAGNVAALGTAHAAAMDAKDVTVMLVRAQAIDSRCKILSANENQELRDLVARAEISLASKYSVTIARQTLAKGRADGKTAACDATASNEVRNILKAAMTATARQATVAPAEQPPEAAPAPQPAPQVAAATPARPASMMKPEPKGAAKIALPKKLVVAQKLPAPVVAKKNQAATKKPQTASQVSTKVKTEKKVSLASYSNLAERYYVELKCRNMSLRSAKRMYQEVLAQHRATLAAEGAPTVRRMLKNAQSRAGAQSCS
jgi:hypothetical protein